MPSLLSCLTSELDDFDNPAGWDDFTLQVFDKFPEVDDFHNLADFDAFTVRVDLADFDAWKSKLADHVNYSALQLDLRIPSTSLSLYRDRSNSSIYIYIFVFVN